MAGVTVDNLTQGPGTLYYGAFGATEPTDAAVNTTPPSSSWTDLGGTTDGSTITLNQTWSELKVDQVIETVGRRLTQRDTMVKTNLAEPTLANLALSLNNTAPASGSGYLTLDLDAASSATQPTYRAFILDGYGPSGYRRRAIIRRALNTSNIELAYKKDGMTVIPVEFASHYVSSSIKSVHVVDQTA